MTRVYFVRHAQPDFSWREDRTRPLTDEGKRDSKMVLDFLRDRGIQVEGEELVSMEEHGYIEKEFQAMV